MNTSIDQAYQLCLNDFLLNFFLEYQQTKHGVPRELAVKKTKDFLKESLPDYLRMFSDISQSSDSKLSEIADQYVEARIPH